MRARPADVVPRAVAALLGLLALGCGAPDDPGAVDSAACSTCDSVYDSASCPEACDGACVNRCD